MQLRAGQIFNIEAGKKALRNVNGLALFSNIEVNPRPDEENDGGIVVEVKLKELEQKTAEVSTEWSIVPGAGGRPSLVKTPFDSLIITVLRLWCEFEYYYIRLLKLFISMHYEKLIFILCSDIILVFGRS